MVIKEASSTPADLRRTHRGLVLSRIQAQPGISRADLARSFGFSEMAATRIARDLLGAGIIEEVGVTPPEAKPRRRMGRPKIGLRVNPAGLYAAGITVSAYYSEVSICDANGKTVARRDVGNTSFKDIKATAGVYARALHGLIGDAGIDAARIVGVGVALSAKTAPHGTRSLRSEYFGWQDDAGQFWAEIQQATGLPVVIENIANALAISEMRFGVARAVADFALVHVATFAGLGVVSGSEIVRGVAGEAGSIGHLRGAETPLRCTCGRSDCINLSATGFGVLARLGQLDHGAFDPSKLPFYAASLLQAVDDRANAGHLRAAGAALAQALDPVAKLLAPRLIVLSGVLGADEAYFTGAVQTLAAGYAYGPASRFELVKGQILPSEAASLLALHTFGYSDLLEFERLLETPAPSQPAAAHV